MKRNKITFLVASLLLCWGSVLAKYELIVVQPTAGSDPCDGSITATATGNAGPYYFQWFNENETKIHEETDSYSSTISEFCGEVYSVIVENKFGCQTVLCETMELDIMVFLEGPYDATLDENNKPREDMNTTLNNPRGLLPGQIPLNNSLSGTPVGQPYSVAPWDYYGKEGKNWTSFQLDNFYSDVVDWVLVSIRKEIGKSTEIETRAGLLKKNGSIFFPKKFCKIPNNTEVYLVVEHRNHLPIMSHVKVEVSNNILTHDFTLINSYGKGGQTPGVTTGEGQIYKNGKYMMLAGNFDQTDTRFQYNGTDKAIWVAKNGSFDAYNNSDTNLDGDINGQDKAFWVSNNGKFSVLFNLENQ